MIEVADAESVILEHARPLPPQAGPPALGRVLAEDVASDIDMPPFDKAMMDGFAVRSADLATGPRVLEVIEEITAGHTPTKTVSDGQAARIMTGAPLPPGADAVVMVERCEVVGETTVSVPGSIETGLNIQPKARELQSG